MQLQRATRKKVKIKMSISSPTGFGKTYSALLLAHGITKDWTKIAVIDTENNSASLYSHLGEFNTVELRPPFVVEDLEKAVKICIESGMEVIILDSVYHFWQGVLDYVDQLGGGFQNWKKGTPLWERLKTCILQSPAHFICTIRKKQAYDMVKKGEKSVVEKKGMEDQVREGFDYEMTIAFNLITENHLCHVDKDRTELFTGKQEFVITEETGKMIKDWCETGVEVPKEEKKKETIKKTEPVSIKPGPSKTEVHPLSELPPLSPASLKTILNRYIGGEKDVLDKMWANFTLTPEQHALVQQIILEVDKEKNKKSSKKTQTT